MHLSTFKTFSLSLSVLAVQNAVQATPMMNCQPTDFELPEAVLTTWKGANLPPFVTPEIFTTITTLIEGWNPGFANTETPIVIRIARLADTMNWNCAAMYSSTWLDALTKEEPLLRSPPSYGDINFHESTPRLLCMLHAWAAVVKEWHPESFPTLSGILQGLFEFENLTFGFNPDVDEAFRQGIEEPDVETLVALASENCYNPKIMGAIVARQLTEYGRSDGYNMYGDLTRRGTPCVTNCRRYTDPTGYTPGYKKTSISTKKEKREKKKKNSKGQSSNNNDDKFRWKPMLEDDGRGYFTRQEHVTPHIGKTAKRAVLSDADFESRVASIPDYNYNEEAFLVAERLRATAEDDDKKAKIEFYDDKLGVIMTLLPNVASYGLSFEQLLNFVVGLSSSEYDSVLVSWKEKVATDLVRPTTWIQEQMSDTEFETYGGPTKGVMTIKGENFESWVRVMPHSEHVSGSACLCQTIMEFTEEWMELTKDFLPGAPFNTFVSGGSIMVAIATDETGRGPPFLKGSSKTEPGVTPSSDLTLVTPNMKEFRDQCGESRLDGGMHFSKSVPAAYELCEGIGIQGVHYSMDLLGEGGWADLL